MRNKTFQQWLWAWYRKSYLRVRSHGNRIRRTAEVDLYIGVLGKEAKAPAYKIVNDLRKKGYIIETDYMDRSVRAQMKYANRINAKTH